MRTGQGAAGAGVAYMPLCALPARLLEDFSLLPDALCFTFGGFALLAFWPFALPGGEASRLSVLAARDGAAGANRPIGTGSTACSIGTGSAEGLDAAGASNRPVTAA